MHRKSFSKIQKNFEEPLKSLYLNTIRVQTNTIRERISFQNRHRQEFKIIITKFFRRVYWILSGRVCSESNSLLTSVIEWKVVLCSTEKVLAIKNLFLLLPNTWVF